jgi:protein O-GlcNAc transferase
MNVPSAINQALTFHRRGQLAEAEKLYLSVLADKPRQFEALYYLGLMRLQQGRPADAIGMFSSAAAVRPGDIDTLCNLGMSLGSMARYEEALGSFNRVLAAAPGHVDTLNNKGICLLKLEKHEEAASCFDHVLRIKPDHILALSNRGIALRKLARFEEALACYEKALSITPTNVEALNNRASLLIECKRPTEALQSLERALALKPADADLLCNHGIALHHLNHDAPALQSLDRALAIDPRHLTALLFRGHVLGRLGRLGDASFSYEKVLAIEPDNASAIGSLASCRLWVCDWKTMAELVEVLKRDLRAGRSVTGPIFSVFADPADQLQWAQRWIREEVGNAERLPLRGPAAEHDRIRVAYLSPDFHEHATAHLVAELLERHDHTRFEIIGIGYGHDDGSAMRRRLVDSFSQFHDVRSKSDQEAGRLIFDLGADIAVDLKGLTDYGRPKILAARPAPIQVNYLGYPGTMGADFIDYIIADKVVLPFDQVQFFTEKVVHLPNCYQANDSKKQIAAHIPSKSEVGLPETGFVFCSFNATYKITPPIFDVWMRVLQKVDGSVLWLFQSNAEAVVNLRAAAAARGVDPTRLVFAPKRGIADHLARHRLADLFLDTLPVCAHTTASDALWAGLPLVTCLGSAFVGRVSASLLQAIGVPQLIASNLDDYEALVLKLATQPAFLQSIRAKLSENRGTFPLFDTDRFTRDLETAYSRMWEIYRRGEPPRSIDVEKEPGRLPT